MKIAMLSDIHVDFCYPTFKLDADTDLFIIDGDIYHSPEAIDAVKKLCEWNGVHCPVIFVPGNHDYYRCSDMATLDKTMREQCKEGFNDPTRTRKLPIHFLQNNKVKIGGFTFYGTTLWTDFGGNKNAAMQAQHMINDFRLIRMKALPINALKMIELHRHARNEMDKFFLKPEYNADNTVIITHFCPTYKTDHPGFIGSPLKPYFHVDMDNWINAHQPKLWIFGHTHHDTDFMMGDTRIVSNQRGYEDASGYNREKNWSIKYVAI